MEFTTKVICSDESLRQKVSEALGDMQGVSVVLPEDAMSAVFAAGVCYEHKTELGDDVKVNAVYCFGYYREEAALISALRKDIESSKKASEILTKVDEGELSVSYVGYSFGGGHDEDVQLFDVLRDGATMATVGIYLGERGFELHVASDDMLTHNGYGYRKDCRVLQEYAKEVVLKGVCRDDKEYASRFGSQFPATYEDVSREELFSDSETYEQVLSVL